MKSLMLLLVTLASLSCFSQNGKSKVPSIRILTDDEVSRLERSHVETVTLPYAPDVDVNKEVTTKEFYRILTHTESTPAAKVALSQLQEVYRQLQKTAPAKMIKLPVTISVYACGGCGCSQPDIAGYASCTGNTCWCACCPKPQ